MYGILVFAPCYKFRGCHRLLENIEPIYTIANLFMALSWFYCDTL